MNQENEIEVLGFWWVLGHSEDRFPGILKYSKDGKLQVVYKTGPAPTLFDPRDGARLFSFYRDKREYNYMNPMFDVINSYQIDSAFVTEPWLACSSGDYNLWIIEAADGSLKKINTREGQVEVDVKLNSTLPVADITFLREYQSFVFLLDSLSGIHIFNSMGKFIKSIPGNNITYFNFLGEELYYLEEGKLKFFDLFSAETRELALKQPCAFALLSDERLFLIQKNSVGIFHYTP